jgi:hypothetical protein
MNAFCGSVFHQLGYRSVQVDLGAAARQSKNLDIQPPELRSDTRPEGLAHGLFGGEAGCDVGGRFGVAETVLVFGRTQDATGKPLTKTFERIPNAPDLHQVDSHTQDHGAKRV